MRGVNRRNNHVIGTTITLSGQFKTDNQECILTCNNLLITKFTADFPPLKLVNATLACENGWSIRFTARSGVSKIIDKQYQPVRLVRGHRWSLRWDYVRHVKESSRRNQASQIDRARASDNAAFSDRMPHGRAAGENQSHPLQLPKGEGPKGHERVCLADPRRWPTTGGPSGRLGVNRGDCGCEKLSGVPSRGLPPGRHRWKSGKKNPKRTYAQERPTRLTRTRRMNHPHRALSRWTRSF
jgi:hypothetical protein